MAQFAAKNLPMVMDLYEMTMANGYFAEGSPAGRVSFSRRRAGHAHPCQITTHNILTLPLQAEIDASFSRI